MNLHQLLAMHKGCRLSNIILFFSLVKGSFIRTVFVISNPTLMNLNRCIGPCRSERKRTVLTLTMTFFIRLIFWFSPMLREEKWLRRRNRTIEFCPIQSLCCARTLFIHAGLSFVFLFFLHRSGKPFLILGGNYFDSDQWRRYECCLVEMDVLLPLYFPNSIICVRRVSSKNPCCNYRWKTGG